MKFQEFLEKSQEANQVPEAFLLIRKLCLRIIRAIENVPDEIVNSILDISTENNQLHTINIHNHSIEFCLNNNCDKVILDDDVLSDCIRKLYNPKYHYFTVQTEESILDGMAIYAFLTINDCKLYIHDIDTQKISGLDFDFDRDPFVFKNWLEKSMPKKYKELISVKDENCLRVDKKFFS